VAIELAVGAQATELRGLRHGRGAREAVRLIRGAVPFLDAGDTVPDIEPLVELIGRGAFSGARLEDGSAGPAA
jgi:histidine ammonia-lyase